MYPYLFQTLLSLGVLQALETTLTVETGDLSRPGQVIKTACIEILMYIVETVPSMVREHMLQQGETCDDVSDVGRTVRRGGRAEWSPVGGGGEAMADPVMHSSELHI